MRLPCWAAAAAGAALWALGLAPAFPAVQVSIIISPPPLPVYEQPALPAAGYLWVPGYWAWSDGGYYWVPGTWVQPPRAGLLWTPGYWALANGVYFWHPGYWGPAVGFYGGVDYGFGYDGVGFVGGYWSGNAFYYNRAVTRLPSDVRLLHVYERPPPSHPVSRICFDGGPRGLNARPTPEQLAIARRPHLAPLATQLDHERLASRDRLLRAAYNSGNPAVAATQHPGRFSGRDVVPARGASIPERPRTTGAPARAPTVRAPAVRGEAPVPPGFQPQRSRHELGNNPARATPRPERGGPGQTPRESPNLAPNLAVPPTGIRSPQGAQVRPPAIQAPQGVGVTPPAIRSPQGIRVRPPTAPNRLQQPQPQFQRRVEPERRVTPQRGVSPQREATPQRRAEPQRRAAPERRAPGSESRQPP